MIALVMAAGSGDRWEADYPKQLAPVRGEPLIVRLTRQLKERSIQTFVIAKAQEIVQTLYEMAVPVVDVASERCLAESVLWTAPLWKEHTLIVLGDVIFSEYDMDRLASPTQRITIYHNADIGELFALSFMVSDDARIRAALHSTVSAFELGQARGKMWDVEHRLKADKLGGVCAVRLYQTSDIDTVEEYQCLRPTSLKSKILGLLLGLSLPS